ncbi:M20/M25/M40 family metallo-hydrolase (plasmid) [Arthrobacter sp. zg-Y820]|uniref:M20 family metallopeptidase n=1 Tax=unclassified Arthrobacter TaxID=235627 RepID=UPI001E541C85|nr:MULTISPECIES: M20/M25/M40 family metallo-hydrolase [unclassified Arthrobacter]MCC9198526.1 M20/M25/M40 family metallo-hydrolase [Arthrobacter sp. zg-Y820]MDK1281396.1 M20/M25/M40 family metallo-hydrolase [Arthrobacter sp. zg.Y820]WIB11257.1 M20/M25/M40 family metallo-hydrolase [Arthrobacter sp. zg-Y820]
MDVLELTRQLVAIDSQNPGPGEREIAAAVSAWFDERDITNEIVEFVNGRPNVIATVDHGGAGHLGLTGHLDTKPIGDARSVWRTDPLDLTVEGDTAFGLGTTDMKGAVAAMMIALERFAKRNDLPGKVSLILTADEEQGSDAGAQSLVRSELMPDVDALLIGEPSGIDEPWEAIYLVSRGICCFDIAIDTTQGHSGLSPRLGRNATLVAADVLLALESFAPPIAQPGLVPTAPTVNPGMMIEGGVCFGVWPGHCVVSAEIRTVPGMERDQVREAIEDLVQQTVEGQGTAVVRYHEGSMGWMPATEIDPAHPIVDAAQQAAASVLGRPLPIAAYPGGTDAAYFMGEAGIPTVVSLGPGWLSVAHGANEKVGVAQLYQATDLYEQLMSEYFKRS